MACLSHSVHSSGCPRDAETEALLRHFHHGKSDKSDGQMANGDAKRETGGETVCIWVTLASHLSTADEY